MPSQGGRKENVIMKKFCTRCGHEFEAVGREVICPSCKQAAAEETKKAAVLRAKRASWTGESVPVRIRGRASTVIREFGKANGLPFAESLDELLKNTNYFKGVGIAWQDVEPYKSRRRDKSTATSTATSTAEDAPQDKPQGVTSKPQEAPQTAQAAKTSKATSKTKKVASTSKAADKGGKKA